MAIDLERCRLDINVFLKLKIKNQRLKTQIKNAKIFLCL